MSHRQEEAIKTLMAFTAQLMAKKTPKSKIQTALRQQGASQEVADEIIRVVGNARREAKRKQGKEEMKRGFWVVGVGLLITVITYGIAAGSGGGTYILAWGAILVGALYILQGFFKSL